LTSGIVQDNWALPNAYDYFMGRWSHLIAREFVEWLEPESGLRWFEMGCGTGALTSAILEHADPLSVLACEPSETLLKLARERISDQRVTFSVGSAADFPRPASKQDMFVSGLVLNFIPEPKIALESIAQFLEPGGIVGAYVWDYAGGMEFLRAFWDVASIIDPAAAELDEGKRFPLCAPDPLKLLFQSAGLKNVETAPLEIVTRFKNFADYWEPFLGGTGPAPSYVASLDKTSQAQLAETLRDRLSPDEGAGFDLAARAWAVRGVA